MFSSEDSSMRFMFVFDSEFHPQALKVFCSPTFVLSDVFALPDLVRTPAVPVQRCYIHNTVSCVNGDLKTLLSCSEFQTAAQRNPGELGVLIKL